MYSATRYTIIIYDTWEAILFCSFPICSSCNKNNTSTSPGLTQQDKKNALSLEKLRTTLPKTCWLSDSQLLIRQGFFACLQAISPQTVTQQTVENRGMRASLQLFRIIFGVSATLYETQNECAYSTYSKWVTIWNEPLRIHTHNILFQSVGYSIMINVLWVFFILLWKGTKIIKLYQYHSTISFASLTWTQVQIIFTVTTVLQNIALVRPNLLFLCEQEKWWKSQCDDWLILNGLIAENITRSHHENPHFPRQFW